MKKSTIGSGFVGTAIGKGLNEKYRNSISK